MKHYQSLRGKYASFIYERRAILTILIFIALTFFMLVFNMSYGDNTYSITTVIKTLFGFGNKVETFIIRELRLPRSLVALLIGASLALSGSIIQTIIKNPLASPDLIGISSGGLLGTLVFLTIFTDPYANSLTVSIQYMPLFSFLGAILAALLVYFLAFKNGVTPYRLILIGIAISGAFRAISNILIINGPMIITFKANTFLSGSIYATGMQEAKLLFVWLIIFVIFTIIFIRDLNVLHLDDQIVRSVGSKLETKRLVLLLISTAIAASAVAIGGAIGFVGLIAPHITRRIANVSFGNMLPLSLLVGGIITLIADLVGRTIFYPTQVPVGVFTSLIGAPFFIYLLWKRK